MKTPIKIIVTIIFAALFLQLTACEYKPRALGDERKVYVFADSLLWIEVQEEVRNEFEKYIRTPRVEKNYALLWRPLSRLNELKQRKNLLFVGTTDSENETNTYLKNVVPAEFYAGVNANTHFHFFKDNLFAKEQITLFMLAKTTEQFKSNYKLLEKDVVERFKEKYFERLKNDMFAEYENIDLEEYILNYFSYNMRIQHDYFLATQEVDEKYFWIRRLQPDRWLSVWRLGKDVDRSMAGLMDLRDEMTAKYYDGDIVVAAETAIDSSKLNGLPALKLTGTWKNMKHLIGGPFRNWLVYNTFDDNYYMIDIAVMAPSKDKVPYLHQLEVMARTFSFADPQNNKKDEE